MYVACTYIQLCTGIRAEGRFRKTHDREVWRMRRVYGKKRILELEGMARSQIFLYIFRYIFVDIYFDIYTYIYILIFLMRGVWCGVCIKLRERSCMYRQNEASTRDHLTAPCLILCNPARVYNCTVLEDPTQEPQDAQIRNLLLR